MKKTILSFLLVLMLLLSGCATGDSIVDEVVDQVTSVAQSEEPHILTIQSAEMNGTSHTYKEVFDNFFAYPTWKYFIGENGEKVVEFTGECLYDEQQVKARIQFVITNETEDYMEWDTTYLSFNDVSQNLFMLSALLETAVEEYENSLNTGETTSAE